MSATALWSSVASAVECDADAKSVDPTPVVSGFGLGPHNHRFVPDASAGITPETLPRLQLKWVFALPDTEAPRFMPLVTRDTLLVGDAGGMVYALDRDTGCEKWRFDAGSVVRTAFQYTEIEGRALATFGTIESDVVMVDLKTGEEVLRTKVAEHPQAMISGSAVQGDGVIYQPISSWEVAWAANPFYGCCTFRGNVVAMDAASGELLWRAYTIAEEAAVVNERLLLPDELGPSGAPVWSQPTLDAKRQRLYVGTGQNYSSPANETSNAIIAFDTANGDMLWSQQFMQGDAWNLSCVLEVHPNCPEERGGDLDFGAPPILVNLPEGDFILAGQKSGRVFAMDAARDGDPLWQYLAGAGGKAGGIHFAMAADPGRGVLYVPVSDRDVGSLLGDSSDGTPDPALHAVDIASGKALWRTEAPGTCMQGTGDNAEAMESCHRGFSAPVTATDQLVFAPTLDGVLRVFDARSGEELWAFDTLDQFDAVNGGVANGGALDYGGAFVADGQVFISSGYGQFDQQPGNAFMVFELAPETGAVAGGQ